jgi:hypothetical protein
MIMLAQVEAPGAHQSLPAAKVHWTSEESRGRWRWARSRWRQRIRTGVLFPSRRVGVVIAAGEVQPHGRPRSRTALVGWTIEAMFARHSRQPG